MADHVFARTCKIHRKHRYPFDLHKKTARVQFDDLISVQIAECFSILPDN